ncbi:MAG: DUF5131 family protein [Actinobacteria bacterium]|nr:DUF5131 family protein [Actinomycetota bacterium]
MGQPNYRDGFAVRTHEHMLRLPLTWSKPRMVFVNSMGDLFHEEVPVDFIQRVFEIMDNEHLTRVEHLRKVPATVRFLSVEPLLGPLPDLDLLDVDWVIVGGESGPGARPVDPDWVLGIRDRCVELGVPFFFKQWGGVRKKAAGRELESRIWEQMPVLTAGVA